MSESNRYQYLTGEDEFVVIDSAKGSDNDEYEIVSVNRRVKAQIICELLNEKEDLIDSKPLDLHVDFKEWDSLIEEVNKNVRRLSEIKEIYQSESDRLLEEAREVKIDFKALYGGNNATTRKQWVDEQLSDLLDEKKELEFKIAENNRKVSFLKKLIDMKIQLLRIGVRD